MITRRTSVAFIALGVMLSVAAGCNTESRISRLEKQTKELQEQIGNQRTTADFDLQAKCSRDAREWFKENWSRDKDTVLLDYTNHYNKSMNKCFVLVEYHYSLNDGSGSWVNDMTVYDVYENSKYGSFSENHMVFFKPKYRSESEVITCELLDKKCKTIQEFNNLASSYLNN